jgi:hypothetical protein
MRFLTLLNRLLEFDITEPASEFDPKEKSDESRLLDLDRILSESIVGESKEVEVVSLAGEVLRVSDLGGRKFSDQVGRSGMGEKYVTNNAPHTE